MLLFILINKLWISFHSYFILLVCSKLNNHRKIVLSYITSKCQISFLYDSSPAFSTSILQFNSLITDSRSLKQQHLWSNLNKATKICLWKLMLQYYCTFGPKSAWKLVIKDAFTLIYIVMVYTWIHTLFHKFNI